ncbi:RluA family pseudouridine synthase [Streptococcus oriscaviae]|uniref:Pseudouridine synthase n=1 Tax=Streptococcus oriscaviae TaxID=2781599 RepID=A0ABX7YMN0_9STRE|nr:RluA family pseudouridine synthase [Streptococcus oriscaviae]QUE54692.1 RluA family pseudouridine synthase [Streptococcus oriscaviae]
MRFEFVADQQSMVKTFLRRQDVSRGLLAKIKYAGGQILVNDEERLATYQLSVGDKVTIDIPPELDVTGQLEAIHRPLDIVYEDEHFMAIDKPFGYASIPSILHSSTIANFVKGYFVNKGYENRQVHIVTRLDRDTSGLMLFAKHGYAHARLDKQLQSKTIHKRYYALVQGKGELSRAGDIIAPIGRPEDSIITRCVSPTGKYAHTSYEIIQSWGEVHLVDIQLHTGRTHQIRVHFAHIGFPLLGDDLYGGSLDHGIERQALHCHRLTFDNPFVNEQLNLTSPLPADFQAVIKNLNENKEIYNGNSEFIR